MQPLPYAEPLPASNVAREAIAQEIQAGFAYMFWGRLAVLTILALWVTFAFPFERSALYLAAITAFALLGALPYLLTRWGIGSAPMIAALLLLEAGIISYILIVPMPYNLESWTSQLNLRLPGFLYLGVFLVAMALSYSPALVVWTGISVIAAWSVGYLWVANLPDSISILPLDLVGRGVSSEHFVSQYLDPHAIRPNFFVNQIAFFFLMTVILALTVWRSRRLIHRVLTAERQREIASEQQRFVRETFGKYVPDSVVTQILTDRGQLVPQKRPATVLFADLEGFTDLSERVSPEVLLRLLNEFFEEAGRIITSHGGTINQFQGDALLASFNVPVADEDHAYHAVCAAKRLVSKVASKEFEGEKLRVRIGVNTGDVAAGAVGSSERLSYTILGDCVNVAARLEQLNKQTGTQILMTAKTAQAVHGVLEVKLVGEFEVRGISRPMKLYTAA